MTVIRESNEQLQRSVHQFIRTIRALSGEQFLQPMSGWSPRDVVAHLIGWNRGSIDVVDAICRGETPEVFIDAGEDFSKVNAAFVHQYDSTDMIELLREMELSYQELARHLYTVELEDWTREVTVPVWDNPMTIEQYIQAVSKDYDNHRQEIEVWRQVTPAV
jgi:hypothetical protein